MVNKDEYLIYFFFQQRVYLYQSRVDDVEELLNIRHGIVYKLRSHN